MYSDNQQFISADEVVAVSTGRRSLADSLVDAIPMIANAYTQRQQIKLQLERAKQGLPALDLEQYSPPVQVRVGMTDTSTYLMLGGAALLAFLLLRKKG